MSIESFTFLPKDLREWQNFFREAVIVPSAGSITDETFGNRAARSVIGRPEATAGTPSDIVFGADNRFLVRRSGVVTTDGLIDADIPSGIARDTEVSAAISAHEGAGDPHPGYLTQSEGDGRYRELTDAVTYAELTGKPAVLALLFSGTGTPEGAVTSGVGGLYLRTDGGAGTTLYVKESGTGNTGWVAK